MRIVKGQLNVKNIQFRYPTDGGEPCPKSPRNIGVCRNARCVDRAWYGKRAISVLPINLYFKN